MNKVIEINQLRYKKDTLKSSIQRNGKDMCLDELIKVIGVEDKYIFTIHNRWGRYEGKRDYLRSFHLDYSYDRQGDQDTVEVRLVVFCRNSCYHVGKLEIEVNTSTRIRSLYFTDKKNDIDGLVKYIGSDEYKYKLNTVTGEEIECNYITEAEVKITPDDATGVNQQKLLIHTEYDNWYTVNKVEVHKVEKWT